MKAIKKINNNVVICVDSNNNELIAMGKGVGFGDFPRELNVADIQRTFYDLDEAHLLVMKDLPDDVVLFAGKIIDMAKNILDASFSGNVVLSLADHIAFAIERCTNNIKVKMPLAYDIEQFYPKECKIAEYTIDRMAKMYKIYVPKSEIYGVAMILINGQIENKEIGPSFEEITDLLNRLCSNESINSDNEELLSSIKECYPEVYKCSQIISSYLEDKFNKKLSEEEKLYMVLHINRVCAKEEI